MSDETAARALVATLALGGFTMMVSNASFLVAVGVIMIIAANNCLGNLRAKK